MEFRTWSNTILPLYLTRKHHKSYKHDDNYYRRSWTARWLCKIIMYCGTSNKGHSLLWGILYMFQTLYVSNLQDKDTLIPWPIMERNCCSQGVLYRHSTGTVHDTSFKNVCPSISYPTMDHTVRMTTMGRVTITTPRVSMPSESFHPCTYV